MVESLSLCSCLYVDMLSFRAIPAELNVADASPGAEPDWGGW